MSKQQALDKTLQLLTDNPSVKPIEIGCQIGRSRQTVYDYLKELEQANKIHRNGSGIIVT